MLYSHIRERLRLVNKFTDEFGLAEVHVSGKSIEEMDSITTSCDMPAKLVSSSAHCNYQQWYSHQAQVQVDLGHLFGQVGLNQCELLQTKVVFFEIS